MATPYLFFNGRCDEALEFYRKALGAEVQMLMRFKDNPSPEHNPPGSADKVMHASMNVGGSAVMASDGMESGEPRFQGFSLTYNARDEAEARRRFDALAGDGGKVQMPFGETFFAKAFGGVRDKFGVSWMVIAGTKNP
ncbi:MAG TPA: VOC family protein [Steroidobacteraceae bacterium]|nr:VOC family protein [Steroidobacteraceae bacterium]